MSDISSNSEEFEDTTEEMSKEDDIKEQIAKLQRQITNRKGRLTSAIKKARETMSMFGKIPGDATVKLLAAELSKVSDAFESIEDVYRQVEAIDPNVDNAATYQASVDAELARKRTVTKELMLAINDLKEPKRIKVDDTLKPFTLTKDSTPMDLTEWTKKLFVFFEANQIFSVSACERQGYFYKCLDTTLSTRIRAVVDKAAPVFDHMCTGPATCFVGLACLDFLKKEFLVKYPLYNRRLDFFRYNQAKGQDWRDWCQKLEQMGEEAEIAALKWEDILILRWVAGTFDRDLKEELMKEAPKTREKLLEVGQAWLVTQQKMGKPANQVNSVRGDGTKKKWKGQKSDYKKNKDKKGQNKSAQSAEVRQYKALLSKIGACHRCGQAYDPSSHGNNCDAAKDTCNFCKEKGHRNQVCAANKKGRITKLSKAQARSLAASPAPSTDGSESGQLNAITHVRSLDMSEVKNEIRKMKSTEEDKKIEVRSQKTEDKKPEKVESCVNLVGNYNANQSVPRMRVRVQGDNGSGRISSKSAAFRIDSLPDSGTTRAVIGSDLARTYGIKVHKNRKEKIRAANGQDMQCEGAVDLIVSNSKYSITVDCLVSADLNGELYLSWHDLVRLGVLPECFPDPVCRKVESGPENDDKRGLGPYPGAHLLPSAANPMSSAEFLRKDRTAGGQPMPEKLRQLLMKYETVYDEEIKPMKGQPLSIALKETGVRPMKCLTARNVPLALQEEAMATIEELIRDDVIEKVDEATTWISPAFFVPKKGPGARLVTDYSHLNDQILRPVWPFPSARQILQNMPPSTYFITADCKSGYFQIELDEASRALTTFLLPWGRFRYKRAPQGLNCSGDAFCARTDAAFAGMKVKGATFCKLVDDILIAGETQEAALKMFEEVLKRCQKHRITLAKGKTKCGNSMDFAGYILSDKGILPDPEKLEAIRDFPAPKDLTGLRGFLGLTNQLGHFIPDLVHATHPLRSLLKKGVAYVWLQEHQEAFEKVKKMLLSDLVVRYFEPKLKTKLLCDASREGIGYCLVQVDPKENEDIEEHKKKEKFRLIQCGSRSLNPAEKRYSTTELELLGIQWAIQHCKHYLYGIRFTVITDHRPLVGCFDKGLFQAENPRIQRIMEKTAGYTFNVEWVPGKNHYIADCLSRNPVFVATKIDEEDDQSSKCFVNAILESKLADDPALEDLLEFIKEDNDYQKIREAIESSVLVKKLPSDHPAKTMQSVWSRLSTLDSLILYDGNRMVIPESYRPIILDMLHKSHAGISRTRQLAQRLYFWPGINAEIKRMIDGCSSCQELRASQPTEPIRILKTLATQPFSHLVADLFASAGKNYLIVADRFSAFVWTFPMKRLTQAETIDHFESLFDLFGLPKDIVSDGGPQFQSDFVEFCKENRITHDKSSPYNSQSNGAAEAAVKQAKYLLIKYNNNYKSFLKALREMRNVPRHGENKSPAELFFGWDQRGILPKLALKKDEGKLIEPVSVPHRVLRPLKTGEKVLMQDPISKRWTTTGKVLDVTKTGRSYIIHEQNGRIKCRNRRFLKPALEIEEELAQQPEDEKPEKTSRTKKSANSDDLSVTNCKSKRSVPLTGKGERRFSPRLAAKQSKVTFKF